MRGRGPLDRLRSQVVLGVVVVGALATVTMGGAVALVGLAGGVVSVLGRLLPPSRGSWRIANIAVLVGCVVGALVTDVRVEIGLTLVAWLQVHRSCTGRAPSDDRVAVLLSLLQVLLACIQSISGWLAPLFVAFAVLVPIALVLAHVVESAPEALDPTAGPPPGLGSLWTVGPVTAVLTIALFFGLPRLEAGNVGSVGEEVGLGDEVRIGELGEMKSNPALALRATVRDAAGRVQTGPFYFRGTAFDHFTGDRWTSTLRGSSERAAVGRVDHPDVVVQEIVLEPLQDGVLVAIPGVVRLEFDDPKRARRDLNGVWRRRGQAARRSYTAWSVPADAQDRRDPMQEARLRTESAALRAGVWTSLPPNLDPRVAELAERLVTEAGVAGEPRAEAAVMERWLRTEFAYTLVPEPSLESQPLAAFLFDTQRGHCEYFATALAVLLRTRGIPARVVGGFYGGEPNPFADWVLVRQSDAHAWVEAHVGNDGWVQLDATPAAAAPSAPNVLASLLDLAAARWQTVILDYSLETQIEAILDVAQLARGARLPAGAGAASAVGMGLGGTMVGLVLAVMGFIALGLGVRIRLRGPARARVTRELIQARTLVRRRGWEIPADLPPVEAAEWLVTQAGYVAEPLRELAWLHYGVRYGGQDDGTVAVRARHARKRLEKSLPRRRRG